MKKKILFSLLGLFILLISAAIIIPFIYKNEIKQKITEEINKNINAKVSFGDVDLSILKNFPNLQIAISEIKVSGIEEFTKDTLANIKEFDLSVDMMSVLRGKQIQIKNIYLDSPNIFAKVLKNGKANWDISKPSKDEEASKFKIALQKYTFKNAKITYEDASMDFKMQLTGFNHEGKGDFTQDLFVLETLSEAETFSVAYGPVTYLNKVHATIKADLEMDLKNFKFTFKNNAFSLNELEFGFDGYLAMPKEDMDMNLTFHAQKNEFKNFISILPAIYTKDFSQVKSSGKLAFSGNVKGLMTDKKMPSFALNLQVENGMFRYPSLPTEVRNVNISLQIKNPDGIPDHTLINLAKLHFEAGKDPFDARLIVKTPISDAQIDATLKGKINFENIQNIVPLEKGTILKGILDADFAAKGKMSTIENKRYEDFYAAGKMRIQHFKYSGAGFSRTIDMPEMSIDFTPKNVNLTSCNLKIGKTDLRIKGSLDNFIAYAIKNETLKGTLEINSSLLDLNELMGEEQKNEEKKSDTATLRAIKIPGNIDFSATFSAGTILYEKMILNNFKGKMSIKEEKVNLENIDLQALDGSMHVNGLYDSHDLNAPKINFGLEVKDLDIQKTIKTFNTVSKLAPIGEKCNGKISSTFHFSGSLDQHMQMQLKTLSGGGNLKSKAISVNNFEPLAKLSDHLKIEKFKKMELKDLNISFQFKDGKVFIDPFTFETGSIKTTVQGSNGFDQSIQYEISMDIPKTILGSAANQVMNGLISKANEKGAKFSMGDQMHVEALISGTVAKPVITSHLKGDAQNAVSDLKNKALEELDKKKKEAEEKIKSEAEKIKKTAEEKVNAEKEKLKNEAEKIKQEAADKAKAEQERIKQEIEKKKKEAEEKAKKEAKEKLKNLFK